MKSIVLGLWLLLSMGFCGGPAWAQQNGSAANGLQSTLEYNKTNQATKWVDPDTGKTGSITPIRTFTNAQGQPCREFTENIFIAGKEQQGYGTACRQPDGTWQIVATPPPAGSNSSASAPSEAPAPPPAAVQPPPSTTYLYPYPYAYSYSWGYPVPDDFWGAYYAPYNIFFGFRYAVWPRHHFYRHGYRPGRYFHARPPHRWDRNRWDRGFRRYDHRRSDRDRFRPRRRGWHGDRR